MPASAYCGPSSLSVSPMARQRPHSLLPALATLRRRPERTGRAQLVSCATAWIWKRGGIRAELPCSPSSIVRFGVGVALLLTRVASFLRVLRPLQKAL
jgi:hypothetical protein